MKIFSSRRLWSFLLIACGTLFLSACSDSDGVAGPADEDSDDDVVLPSLATQIDHWTHPDVRRGGAC